MDHFFFPSRESGIVTINMNQITYVQRLKDGLRLHFGPGEQGFLDLKGDDARSFLESIGLNRQLELIGLRAKQAHSAA
ncbi:MAG TPA: hypothetical protein VKZ53_12010 [Candidatus Angelobacter sp.]|nr:hypothetical protein [Candidatus Angelobacter sp.]